MKTQIGKRTRPAGTTQLDDKHPDAIRVTGQRTESPSGQRKPSNKDLPPEMTPGRREIYAGPNRVTEQ